jgi:DNA-binding NarL/FixJ family response regulator
MSRDVRVAIVEDQRSLREGLVVLIGSTEGFTLVGAFGSMEEALPRIETDPPDVLLADIGWPGMSGTEGVRRLRARFPALQILMLTVCRQRPRVRGDLRGCVRLSPEGHTAGEAVEALREVRDGGAPMSPRSRARSSRCSSASFRLRRRPITGSPRARSRSWKLLAEGHVYKTAAAALDLSIDTVRFHIRNIYEKLHVHSKSEAALAALRADPQPGRTRRVMKSASGGQNKRSGIPETPRPRLTTICESPRSYRPSSSR